MKIYLFYFNLIKIYKVKEIILFLKLIKQKNNFYIKER